LGKGITVGALGHLLKARGISVRLQKLDPYINIDPGTMNPEQHGEVYVTDDGAETDLDLGHYERFTGIPLTKDSNWTTGQIYQEVIDKERRGDYLGNTVQVIPHITDEIKSCIRKLADDDVDIVIVEIGGTVGDIESLPFMEAIRQMRFEEGRENTFFIHLTLVPYIKAAGEIKTKPTQHSVGKLREIGIQPDLIVCRSEVDLEPGQIRKIALFCNVSEDDVIQEKDVGNTIYEVPGVLADQELEGAVLDHLGIDTDVVRPASDEFPKAMRDYVKRYKGGTDWVNIIVVGKYDLQDAYKSVYEALDHAAADREARVRIIRINSEDIEKNGIDFLTKEAKKKLLGYKEDMATLNGIVVPGGFGDRGIEGKIAAIRFARETKIPLLGLCLGMQCAVIEFARNVMGLQSANSHEFDPDTEHPVINLMVDQEEVEDLGGTMRLGAYECLLLEGSKVEKAYGEHSCSERHRHRYEFNNDYTDRFVEAGMVFSGMSPDGQLVEMVELPDHPWFVATQAHPEFKSRPEAPAPLFRGFIDAALKSQVAVFSGKHRR
jgi:CTP synthase